MVLSSLHHMSWILCDTRQELLIAFMVKENNHVYNTVSEGMYYTEPHIVYTII